MSFLSTVHSRLSTIGVSGTAIAERVAEGSVEYMGNIGENPKEWEFEPIEEPSSVPEPIQAPVPAEPVKVPEEVPA